MNGTLEDTTPAGVLQVLSSQGSTGAVRFHGDSGCTVYLHHGELYFAESTETAEDLAVALVRPGRLTADQWDASTDAGYPSETVGEELIATGGVTRELLASVVLSVIYDPLIQLFRAPEGDYEFAPDVVHWIGAFRSFAVDAIVSEVRRRTREADEMAPVVPSLDALVRSARTLPETHGSVNLRRDDWEVVIAAANGCSVNELAVELGRGRWSTARIVYRLATADLLMVSAEDESDLAFPADTDTDTAFSPDTFAADSFSTDFAPDPFATDSSATEAPTRPDPNFGFDTVDAPPPLDESLLEGDGTDSNVGDPDSWDLDEPVKPTAGDDPWGEFDSGSETSSSWDTTEHFGDSPSDESTDTAAGPSTDTEAGDDNGWAGGLTAVPDTEGDPPTVDGGLGTGGDTEPPGLHPDIAKALAESTYADSATAINAMAARLGAIESDDDDVDEDWDRGTATDTPADDEFWSDGAGGSEGEDFIWKPAVWDTGVEAAPLPQREAVRTAPGPGGDQSSDPAWLDNLYAEFMPGDPNAAPPADTAAAGTSDPGAAPKQRTLRRLMSAIRRL